MANTINHHQLQVYNLHDKYHHLSPCGQSSIFLNFIPIILTHSGPPESMREHVVAASKEMSKGNWRECADFVLAVKVNMH